MGPGVLERVMQLAGHDAEGLGQLAEAAPLGTVQSLRAIRHWPNGRTRNVQGVAEAGRAGQEVLEQAVSCHGVQEDWQVGLAVVEEDYLITGQFGKTNQLKNGEFTLHSLIPNTVDFVRMH